MAPADELGIRIDRERPVGDQLAEALRSRLADGSIGSGERLPSVRELAAAVGVNVNTVRAVYARLEHEGAVRSEHGRGTFAAGPSPAADRRELREQIEALESRIARHATGIESLAGVTGAAPAPGRVMSTAELRAVRDDLTARLAELEAARSDVLARLEELRRLGVMEEAEAEAQGRQRRSTPTLGGARVRFTGAS